MRTTACLAVAALTATVALTSTATAARAESAHKARPAGPPTVKTVTLITGDVVRVSTGGDGRHAVTLQPRPDGTIPQAAVNQVHNHLYVVPTEAFGLLAANKIDRDLFDVTALLDDKYDDASRPTLPVMVDYGTGRTAAAEAKGASLLSADRTVTVPELGIAAFHADKKHARAFWKDLTTGADTAGNPTGLADGATHVDLDGRVHVDLEDSVPQIHAPQAWAAGFDGKGATVAILDTGYDPTHPDLAGRVTKTANFTTDATVTDGNGHGTHVASTVGGSGAASNGLRKGVAPGADLWVGKVLSDGGYGEDSWVLAGMVWAVDQGADVISMSLGGDPDDGTHPLSRAVNELSASSDTLFVIAAGNSGEAGASTVSSPGAADAALTVGAVDVHDVMAGFSSRGPRLRDGALKPEVVAPGVDVTAARAAGTALGPVVDDLYTTISGTSMATPHVAGLAAILKEEHPTWDGERLKSAIANSTVPVADATGFDAGTGRVDALKAIHQDVLAPASLSLGSYAWPYSNLAATRTALTYTNTADAPVRLSLALTGESGAAEPTGSMRLAADTVTVPANGTASVDVVLDPTVAGPGSYSAVVTATPDDGGETVRTGLAYLLEPERYDVKVTIKPRAGSRSVTHQLGLSGYADPWIYEQRTFDASPDAQSVTFRLPPGTYATGAISFGTAKDGAREGVVTYQPSITVTRNTEIVLDENDTRRFAYQVDRPVVDDGAILDIGWNGDAGYTGYTYYGFADRVYARPSKDLTGGSATIASNWLLSEPEALLTTTSGRPVALRPVTAPAGELTETAVPRLDGHFRVVDAGSAAAPRTRTVRGAVALVSGTCSDLTPAASQLKKAGAVALIAYAGPGGQCAGTIDPSATLPALQARPFDVPRLRTSRPVKLVTHASPGYMYDLVRFWGDKVPAGGTVNGTGRSVAALVEHYNGMGSTSKVGAKVVEELVGWVPERGGVANIGLVRRVPFPSTVTHYVSTAAVWERSVIVQDTAYYGEYGRLWAPRRTFAGGSTTHDSWFGGPVASRVSPLFTVTNGAPPPVREGDELFLSMGAFTDAAGHMANSDLFNDTEFSGQIYTDGRLELDMPASVFMNTTVPAGKHRFRVVTDTKRQNPFWQLSTRVRTQWGFTSDTPKGERDILPMLGVDYRMALSSTNSAPAGRYTFGVAFAMPDGVRTLPVVKRGIQVSWDHGRTWKVARTTKCGATSCGVQVTNRSGKTASLRVTATDSAGRAVSQDVIDAYAVR
ncbi:S8 family peptidase [Angustibacter sp. McL0619]|uniref:S8 family peptidase n=1 Tax=Angustibacter sp. McL0619 TaxID=3415676 RepID=UPI003CF09AF5